MNYSELKPIFDTKTFDILWNLINRPLCELYLPNYESIAANTYDPFEQTTSDVTAVTQGDNILIKADVRCVYTNDKLLVQENDTFLGSKYTLVLYLRADDIPQEIKDNLSSVLIKFNNIFYQVESPLNLYDILYEFRC